MNALVAALSDKTRVEILRNKSLTANKKTWDAMPSEAKELLQISAEAAVETILRLEPRMTERAKNTLTIAFQKDQKGLEGDVRDLVLRRDEEKWEVGLSIKHNHDAVKHSRLSYKLDFGQEWFSVPCSKSYWADARPIFDRLHEQKANGQKWSELDDKEETIYRPLLRAFVEEVQRAYEKESRLPQKMIEYLIGVADFYKVVSHDNEQLTMIHTFNLHGTLGKAGKENVSVFRVPLVNLPTEMVAIRFKTESANTVEMYLNNGWQLSFRIHNASKTVEPSLKFDIRLVGAPCTILNIECAWKR